MRSLLLLILLIFGGAACHHPPRRPEAPPQKHFSLLTYNINWGGPGGATTAEIIKTSGAEIVCLQETTPEWERFLRSELRTGYPFAEFRNSKGRMGGGLAFLSKVPAREVAYIPSNTGWFDGWIMQFETAIGPVQVLNVHLRPPISDKGSWVSGYFTTSKDRLKELARFYSQRVNGMPLIVAGDFNDSARSEPIRWLESKGLINALPQFDRSTPTWHWRYHGITLSRRMDQIIYSPQFHCSAARVVQAGESDHFPIETVLGKSPLAVAPAVQIQEE
jgi:endonuclease/exonuclease/phosphatase (EEP) superfamily protein YafD